MKAYHELYRIARRNLSRYDPTIRMPFSEKQLDLVSGQTDVHVVDLSTVMDLPQMEFVDALYALFQYRTNDRHEEWQKLANAVGEDEFKQTAINALLLRENGNPYRIQAVNNPYGQKGSRLLHLIRRK